MKYWHKLTLHERRNNSQKVTKQNSTPIPAGGRFRLRPATSNYFVIGGW